MKSDKIFNVFVGNIVHSVGPSEIELIENGFIILDNTKIVAIGERNNLERAKAELNVLKFNETILKPSQLLIPGFIDTHIHAVQYPNCGLGYDKPLLEWLNDYTYPMEKLMKNEEFAERVFDAVVNRTLSNGTTTAMYFASLYEHISLLLVESVIKNGQRALVGKVNMTMMAPPDYMESENDSIKKTLQFINKVKKLDNPLVQPVITPRFALSVDMPVMKALGKIAREEDLHIQTHISENSSEVELVEKIYGRRYAQVYDDAGLLTRKTILAHGVHLSEEEMNLISERGASVSHCPESNCLLRSGICKAKNLLDRGINVSLGTDISGGASPSVINAMRAAITSSINSTFISSEKCECLDWKEAFYMATLGGARALRMDNKIGNFKKGKDFDALIIDVDVENSPCDYLMAVTPMENFQKFIFAGDDRNIISVYVAGKKLR